MQCAVGSSGLRLITHSRIQRNIPCWIAYGHMAGRHIFDYNGARADHGMITDGKRSCNDCARADRNAATDDEAWPIFVIYGWIQFAKNRLYTARYP